MLNKNLQNKIIKFSMYTDSGEWRCNGTGKVMIVERGDVIIVSIKEHPLHKQGDLVRLYPWKKDNRYRCDVILKVEE